MLVINPERASTVMHVYLSAQLRPYFLKIKFRRSGPITL